jgi:hypothetical protein
MHCRNSILHNPIEGALIAGCVGELQWIGKRYGSRRQRDRRGYDGAA